MAKSNETLDLTELNFVWRYIIYMPKSSVWNFLTY